MFHKIINLIKNNYNLKNDHVKINKLNKNDFKIIKIFLKLNIIKIVKNKNNNFVLYFKYLNKNTIFGNVKNFYKPSKPCFLNLKEIKKINKKKNNIFILSTNKGLITNFEAEQNNVGGILILTIHI